jgi:RNA polymerase sigma-70 factor (ECF subfamily)
VPELFLESITRLVHGHRARLAAVARREGLLPEDALDCVQEAFHVFLRLPDAASLVDAPDDDAAKLLTILARNAARNRRRRADRARPHDADGRALEALADDRLERADERLARAGDEARLCGCVSQLNEVSRQVVLLRMLDEVPGEDVAAMLGLSPGHVAVLLHRAKASLRACMEGSEQD